MATIFDLPEEIIEFILCQNISIQDFVNFSSTCKYFRNMIEEENIFWQRKFYERWPKLKIVCEKMIAGEPINFKELLQKRMECKKILQYNFKEMSIKNCSCTATLSSNLKDSDSDSDSEEDDETVRNRPRVFNQADNVHIDEKELCSIIHSININYNSSKSISLEYYFIIDEIMDLLKYAQCKYETTEYYNLTNIYNAGKFLPYVKHYHLKNYVWPEFISRPAEQQLLEEAAAFVVQWFKPELDISYSDVETKLDNITQRVMNNFRNKRPGHPIFSEPEQLSFWKRNNIDEDQWDYNDTKQILDIICDVFITLGFYGDASVEDLYVMNIFLINYVLKEKFGHSAMLAILIHSIARRVGICCDVICSRDDDNTRFYLRWKPKSDININIDKKYFYINVWDMCIFKNYPRFNVEANEVPIEVLNTSEKINSMQLILYLTKCLMEKRPYIAFRNDLEMRWLLELQQLVKFSNNRSKRIQDYYIKQRFGLSGSSALFREYIGKYNSKRQKINKMIREYIKMEKNEKTILKYIEKYLPPHSKVKTDYLIGMIVVLEGQTECVINGKIFNKTSCIYTLLGNNNKFLIGTKDELSLVQSPRPIKHTEVGRYFYEFKGTHYQPNDTLASVYPLDILYL